MNRYKEETPKGLDPCAGSWAASCRDVLDQAYAQFVEDMRTTEDPEQLVYMSMSITELRCVMPDTADWLLSSAQAQLLEEGTPAGNAVRAVRL